jgi:hypothetical protein
MMKKSLFIACVAAMVALAGCGDKKDEGQATGSSGSSPSSASTSTGSSAVKDNNASIKKMNAYVKATNGMKGSFPPRKNFERYQKLDIPNAKASQDIYFPDSVSILTHTVVRNLKEGMEISADGFNELDPLAKAFMDSAEKLLAQQQELKGYYESKAYKEDNLAKGKAAHATLMQNYEALFTTYRAFDVKLEKELRIRDEKRAEQYKADGNMVRYNLQMSFLTAQDILATVEVMGRGETPNWAAADESAKKLTAFIEGFKTEVEAMPEDKRPSGVTSVVDYLNRFLGGYRTLKETKKANDYNSMVDKYNSAISSRSSIRFKNGD